MSKHVCWIPAYEEEDAAIDIDADDADEAARLACEWWESHGRWSGDPVPGDFDVRVRTEDGSLFDVAVETSWSVEFYANSPVPVRPQR